MARLWEQVNVGGDQVSGDADSYEVDMLKRMIDGADDLTAIFPMYGAVKAGKSTFLSCIMREEVLPAQALPMTSIPIKLTHDSHNTGAKSLDMKQHTKWNFERGGG